MSTKEKVDVKSIMARAKEKVKTVKQSAENIDAKKDTFRVLPGFKKYEFNGTILRNFATKNIISFKTGRTKYQLFDDKGKSHNLSKDDIKQMLSVSLTNDKPKKEKVEKPAKQKKEIKTIDFKLASNTVTDLSKEDIVKQDCKNNRKHFMLHLKGCDANEINKLTGAPIPSIKRDIWRFETGVTNF